MKTIEEIIAYNFKDKNLLDLALTHSSYAHKYNIQNNERLEFLGDSILGYLIAEYLYQNFTIKEGELSKIRARIVSCENLSNVITKNKLYEYIKTSPENLNENETVKGDFFEALLGAIYLDGGLDSAKKFVFNILDITTKNIEKVLNENIDYKTKLQEVVQAKKGEVKYVVVGEEGKDNNKTFEVELFINNKSVAKAKGRSKQKAENLAASIALKNIV